MGPNIYVTVGKLSRGRLSNRRSIVDTGATESTIARTEFLLTIRPLNLIAAHDISRSLPNYIKPDICAETKEVYSKSRLYQIVDTHISVLKSRKMP